MSQPILQLKDVSAAYGKILAVKNISIEVNEGEIVSMIGANGAGKSTTLMTICGVMPAKTGSIHYKGDEITHTTPDKLPSRGLCQVPEGRRIFPRLSVAENLDMGAFHRKDKAQIKRDIEMCYELFPILRERRHQAGGSMSGGEQQMLAIARALMTKPELLLLDEPSLGLAPIIVAQIFEIIKNINKEQGVSILLVEQNANIALNLADRGYVLETGSVVLEGEGKALLNNPDIRKAYLGE